MIAVLAHEQGNQERFHRHRKRKGVPAFRRDAEVRNEVGFAAFQEIHGIGEIVRDNVIDGQVRPAGDRFHDVDGEPGRFAILAGQVLRRPEARHGRDDFPGLPVRCGLPAILRRSRSRTRYRENRQEREDQNDNGRQFRHPINQGGR